MTTNLKTPIFRAAWCDLIKPKKNDQGKDRWAVTALFKKGADLSVLKNAAKAACEEKWGKDQKKWPANLKTPFHDQGIKKFKDKETGEERLYDGYVDGAIYVNLGSYQKPQIIDKKSGQEVVEEAEVYAGCWLMATFNPFAYEHKSGSKGVSLGLQNVLKVEDDTPFGKIKVSATEDFESLIEDGTVNAGNVEEATSSDDIFG